MPLRGPGRRFLSSGNYFHNQKGGEKGKGKMRGSLPFLVFGSFDSRIHFARILGLTEVEGDRDTVAGTQVQQYHHCERRDVKYSTAVPRVPGGTSAFRRAARKLCDHFGPDTIVLNPALGQGHLEPGYEDILVNPSVTRLLAELHFVANDEQRRQLGQKLSLPLASPRDYISTVPTRLIVPRVADAADNADDGIFALDQNNRLRPYEHVGDFRIIFGGFMSRPRGGSGLVMPTEDDDDDNEEPNGDEEEFLRAVEASIASQVFQPPPAAATPARLKRPWEERLLPGDTDLPAAPAGAPVCLVCQDSEATVMAYPCGHVFGCDVCARELLQRGFGHCIVCRDAVEDVVKPVFPGSASPKRARVGGDHDDDDDGGGGGGGGGEKEQKDLPV
jgi:hypothetical protein